MQLIEGSRHLLDEMIQRLTGVQVVSLHSDMSIKRGERIIVFTLGKAWRPSSIVRAGNATSCPFVCPPRNLMSRRWSADSSSQRYDDLRLTSGCIRARLYLSNRSQFGRQGGR
jgi:hypothetical protein